MSECPDPAGTPGSQPGGSEDDGQRDAPDHKRQPGKGDEQKAPGR